MRRTRSETIYAKFSHLFEDTFDHVDTVLNWLEDKYGRASVKAKTINGATFNRATGNTSDDFNQYSFYIMPDGKKFYLAFRSSDDSANGEVIFYNDKNIVYHSKDASKRKATIDKL